MSTCAPSCMEAAASVRKLAELLDEPDEKWQSRSAEAGIPCSSAFIRAVKRSAKLCRRGSLLYPQAGDLAISFNGGKDACVVLYLWAAAAIAEQSSAGEDASPQQTAIYFDNDDEFDIVRNFVLGVSQSLNLRMITIKDQSFKQGLQDLVNGGVRAVVMGQRRGDPWMDDVDIFSPTSVGWPVCMRVNPILDWSYEHVWTFLRCFGLPYCTLYDEGYTSLGSVTTTLRNPSLRQPDGTYAPAYELEIESLERAGRMSRQVSVENAQPHAPTEAEIQTVDVAAKVLKDRSLSEIIQPKSAGIVLIGNELLNGKVHDCNAYYLCGELHKLGVALSRIETVPDHIDAIGHAVRAMSSSCDYVFTSGGLGPTHDDITMAGVAKAFGCSLQSDERLLNMLKAKNTNGKPNVAACHKMASVPAGVLLEWPDDSNPWPIASMRNVYIFAGMPNVFRMMFQRTARDGRFNGARRWISTSLRLDADEADILDALQQTVDAFPQVEIGSYPQVPSSPSADNESSRDQADSPSMPVRRLTITFEAFDQDTLTQARSHLERALPPEMIVDADVSA